MQRGPATWHGNPPEPGAQPIVTSGPVHQFGPCGRCACIPKHFRLDVEIPLTGNPVDDDLLQQFVGNWVLTRRILDLTDPEALANDARCVFLSRPIDLTDTELGGYLSLGGLQTAAVWSLIYDYWHGNNRLWNDNWMLSAGAWFWYEQPSIGFPFLVPYAPGFSMIGLEEEIGVGMADYYLLNPPDSDPSLHEFRCLRPNTFLPLTGLMVTPIDGVGVTPFPASLTVRPFWP